MIYFVYSSMINKEKIMNKNLGRLINQKEGTYTYWVNKKSGTIHHVGVEYSKYWKNFKLTMSTCNLPYERMYFTRGSDMGAVDRFLKNYDFVCENPTNEFYVNVLGNKKLKSEFSWGLKTKGRLGITKEEFFNKLRG